MRLLTRKGEVENNSEYEALIRSKKSSFVYSNLRASSVILIYFGDIWKNVKRKTEKDKKTKKSVETKRRLKTEGETFEDKMENRKKIKNQEKRRKEK